MSMVLSDHEIQMELDNGRLRFSLPITDGRISPSSVDLLPSNQFNVFKPQSQGVETVIDLTRVPNLEEAFQPYTDTIKVADGDSLVLYPGDFVLAYIREYVELPNYLAARVDGRSSCARIGLSVHQTASTVRETFQGQVRLEISHVGKLPCRLYPGKPICQMAIERLSSPAESSLQSPFQEQRES